MELYENIKALRVAHGWSQQRLADLTGYGDRSSIAKIESGKVDLPQSKIAEFAKIFNVTPAYLMGCDDAPSSTPGILPLPANRSYPLLGNIACGTPILAEENITEYIQFPGDIDADFCLRCRGDSMVEARIHDGDIVFIRQQPEVSNGEIAAVQIGGDTATLKRVYLSEDSSTLTLMAANPSFPPMIYSGEQLASVHILGRAVHFLSAVK